MNRLPFILVLLSVLFASCANERKTEEPAAPSGVDQIQKDIDIAQDSIRTEFEIGDVSFSMIKVDGGTFIMGTSSPKGQYRASFPEHEVSVGDFLMMRTEVTLGLYNSVMGVKTDSPVDSNIVKTGIGYEMAEEFARRLSSMTGVSFRLPTEAEWDWAARGGVMSSQTDYSGSNNPSEVALYLENSMESPGPVSSKAPNSLGLYDMSGNATELCSDYFSGSYYSQSEKTDPKGPAKGTSHVLRGGSYLMDSDQLELVLRDSLRCGETREDAGMRLVISKNR